MLPSVLRPRALGVIAQALLRERVSVLESSTVSMRVWPSDLHLRAMSAATFAVFMETAVNDLFVRLGLALPLAYDGWFPLVRAQTIRYLRPVRPWSRCELSSRMSAWSDHEFVVRVQFVVRDQPVAIGHYLAQLHAPKRGLLPMPLVLQAMGASYRGASSPEPFDEAIKVFGLRPMPTAYAGRCSLSRAPSA